VVDFQERRNRRRKVFFGLIVGGALVACAGVGWVVFKSPVFEVRAIEVLGSEDSKEEVIIDVVKKNMVQHSFMARVFGAENMLFWPNRLTGRDIEALPTVKSIEIEKKYFERTIQVVVEERSPFGVWCAAHEESAPTSTTEEEVVCFWFDGEGTLYRRSLGVEGGSLIKVVNDYAQKDLVLYKKILPGAFLENFFSVTETIDAAGVDVRDMRLIDLTRQELEVRTQSGPTIYFSLRFRADGTRPALTSLVESGNFKSLTSVDFRVENRVYYK